MSVRISRLILAVTVAGFLTGCSGVYFNTTFNAEKAWNQAQRLRKERQERTPDDTTLASSEERTKLTRAITKSSKVLELWPTDPKYAPRAVFLIAEAQLQMGDYDDAAIKYEEFLRYFPKEEKVPLARVRLARALYMDGKVLAAREALDAVLATDPKGEIRREALLLSARMRIDEQAGNEGLAVYEQLLAEGAFESPEGRNEVRWRAAQLAAQIGDWEKARAFALAAGEGTVPVRVQFRNRKLAILASYRLDRPQEGLSEVRALQRQKPYRPYRADLKLLEAIGTDGAEGPRKQGNWVEALRLYRATIKLGSRTPAAAEAWYRIGAHVLEVENREDSARAWFDSAAAAGRSFEYGEKGAELGETLRRLAELRAPDTAGTYKDRPHYRGFMIAEIFHFRLPKPDSARVHLNRIVADTVEDSIHTRRAFYALAWIEANDFANKARADSLYRALMARYPATEWAKQAEMNLGLPPTVLTREDSAHLRFLESERLRLAGGDPARAVAAYRSVVERYPSSRDAARAQFTLAFIAEEQARAKPGQELADSAKAAYVAVRDRYRETPQGESAERWVQSYESIASASESGTGTRSDSGDGEPEEEALDGDAVPRRENLDAADEQDLY